MFADEPWLPDAEAKIWTARGRRSRIVGCRLGTLQIRLCPTETGMAAGFNCQRLFILCLIRFHNLEADALSACFGDFSGKPVYFQPFPATVDSVVSCDGRGRTG